jgi:hypothetical protein
MVSESEAFISSSSDYSLMTYFENFRYLYFEKLYRDFPFFAVGSKDAANLSISFLQYTDLNIFVEKFCQFTRAESIFAALIFTTKIIRYLHCRGVLYQTLSSGPELRT